MAAFLAEQNFHATREFLTAADGGLFNSYSDGGDPGRVAEGLGERWELEQIGLRLWPSATSIQGVITALFDALHERPFTLKDIKSARIHLSPLAFKLHGNFSRYTTKFDAMLSAHYAAAVILQDHVLTLSQFEPSRYNDPVIRDAAANLIDVRLNENLQSAETVVDFEFKDGTTLSKRCEFPLGSVENPLSLAQIEEKMRTYAQNRMGKTAVDQIITAINNLDDVVSIRDMMRSMRTESAALV